MDFTIDSRIGAKDRQIVVYPLEGQLQGFTAFGVEPPPFHHLPAVFALRISEERTHLIEGSRAPDGWE